MKIKQLSIRGFRSLKDISWQPGNLNVLIGPNASGKSNFLRGMELLAEAMTGNLDDAVLRRGGIRALLWDRQAENIEWKIHVRYSGSALDKLTRAAGFGYELLVRPFGVAEITNRYRIDHEIMSEYADFDEVPQREVLKYIERSPDKSSIFDQKANSLAAVPDVKETQTLISQASILSGLTISRLKNYMNQWGIYQDLNVDRESPTRRAAITRRETHLAGNGQNLINVLHTLYSNEKEFKTDLNDAMQAAFGSEFEELEFTPAEDQRIQMRLRWRSLKSLQSAADLSDGTLRFLMLLAILLNRSRGDLVAIDEPETGLHPSMFPIIAELAADAARSSQIIFSTHSPEFLTALGHHNPQTTVVQNVDGETKLSMLHGDDLKRWLEKYTPGELFVSGGAEALT